jgi:2-(1,2-epoxy-1,2-dihydrophenyl)acetyl-CoA isomerase
MFEFLTLEKKDKVAILTLNRPAVYNAVHPPMIAEIRRAVSEIRNDPCVHCLLLTGAGKAFCAGADLGGFGEVEGDPVGLSVGQNTSYSMLHRWNPMMNELHELQKPVVCAMNGVAAGGGVGLALVADVVVAASSSKFVLTFGPKLGIVPDLGSTWMARHIGRGKAIPLAMLGEPLSAVEAERIGLIWKVFSDEEMMERALVIATQLASSPTAAMVKIRHIIDEATTNTFSQQLEAERSAQEELLDHPSSNFSEGAARFAKAEKKASRL